MSLWLDTITIDCERPLRLATFWGALLGFELEADSNDEDGAFVADPSDRSKGLFFQPVPEPKSTKVRIHLDLRPTTSMAVEVERARALGASVQGRVDEGGIFWTVMLDPEGNEFCILRGPDDGWVPETA